MIFIYKDKSLVKQAKKQKTLLEVCFTSNVDTLSVESHLKHPLGFLKELGLNICLNTDDRTVSQTDLELEYERARVYFNYTDKQFKKMNINAMKQSFADKETKKEIIRQLK